MEEVDGGRAGLRQLARLPDVMVVCSSAGWTDQKHMLYLGLLQESFVNRLHDGEIGFRGLFHLSPGASGPKQSANKVDRAKVEQTRPPCCRNQGDGQAAHSMDDDDDDASSTETVQEQSCSQASTTSSWRSSSCHPGKRGRSPSGTAEGSDQNFIDEGTFTREIGESRGRRRSNKRLKSC